jgi:hypothetical protein
MKKEPMTEKQFEKFISCLMECVYDPSQNSNWDLTKTAKEIAYSLIGPAHTRLKLYIIEMEGISEEEMRDFLAMKLFSKLYDIKNPQTKNKEVCYNGSKINM